MRVLNQSLIVASVREVIAKKRSGQVLVETMVALGVATVGIMGIVSLLAQSVATAKFVGDQYVASYLAAEGIENAKFAIDSNVLNGEGFTSPSSSVEILRWNKSTYATSGDTGTPFTRSVSSTSAGEYIEVVSTVSWPLRGGGTSRVTLVDRFYNWRN
jgi:Tfp pilus assembly protein PilV